MSTSMTTKMASVSPSGKKLKKGLDKTSPKCYNKDTKGKETKKMAFYSVEIWDKVFYPCVEADSPEQAERIAEEWFAERLPATSIQQIQPSCAKCYHSRHQELMNSVGVCNCCENFSFYDPV